MPEYKRKKAHTRPRHSKKVQTSKAEIKIPMRFSRNKKQDTKKDSEIRVVRGRKGEKRKKLYTLASSIAAVILIIAIMSLALPVGIFESVKDLTLSLGSGSFPSAISGSQVLNCVPKDNYYYVLTDTSLMAFSNGGKKIFSHVHGFSSPIITTSQTRALVFDQGKNTAIIYNLSGVIDTIESKDEIVTADIAKNGQYALVTKSDSYASSITVYNRKGKSIYNIKLAKDVVNNIDIASSGKRIAVSTVNAQSGKMVCDVRVYGFNSADPAYKLDLGQDIVYDIENTGRGFYVTTHNKSRFVRWSRYSTSEFDFEGETSAMRYSGSGAMAVFNKTNDKSNNNIVLLSNSGKKISEFEIKGIVNDIRFSRGRVYLLSDNKVTIYNKHGEILRSDSCEFGGVKLSVVGSNNVCIITDNEIQKAVIKKGD